MTWFRFSVLAVLLILHARSEACRTQGGAPATEAEMNRLNAEWFPTDDERAPAQASSLNSTPFGGANPSKRVQEAHAANFMTRELKPSSADVVDVTLTFPARIEDSNYPPFGDKQTNSHLTAGKGWIHTDPPVVLKREKLKSGQWRESVAWHPSLKAGTVKRTPEGWILFQAQGRSDWFALTPATGMMLYAEFAKGLPAGFKFKDERALPDPERIRTFVSASRSPVAVLMTKTMGKGYNDKPYPPSQEDPTVHGRFPNKHGLQTAVGGVLTWLIQDPALSPMPKHLYTCFERRGLKAEAQTGAPSGAGWHKVGDAAETIVHSLESVPLLVALGVSAPFPPPSGQWAFGMGESVTARWLQPGEVFVAVRGERHWYTNPYSRAVCTEIWVHACNPTLKNKWGFACKPGEV